MARTAITVTSVNRDGVAPAAEQDGDTTNDHEFANDGRTFLLVRNADGAGAHTVTIITPTTVDGQAVADRAISIPLSTSRYVGPFPPNIYNVGGVVQVDVDSTQLKLSAYRVR